MTGKSKAALKHGTAVRVSNHWMDTHAYPEIEESPPVLSLTPGSNTQHLLKPKWFLTHQIWPHKAMIFSLQGALRALS